jgi:uncharacterized protein (TIGR00251 family)
LNKRPRVEQDLFGALHVFVREPPLEGRANQAVIKCLARHFKVAKSQVELVSGAKGKVKTFLISQ